MVFALSNDGSANLLTDDRSCTVPALHDSTTLPVLGDGRRLLPFSNAAYTAMYDDTGPTDLARTREGSLEVIEMGEVVDGSPSGVALTHVNGVPTNCAALVRAWDGGGYWSTGSATDIARPGGGLYGMLAVVNPPQGTIFEVAATALDGFSAYAQHNAPGNAHPDLGDARSSAIDVQPPYADADVQVQGSIHSLHYVGADRTIDAVSATLMNDAVYGEWVYEPEGVANTELLLTFPTKRHYVDPKVQTSTHPESLRPFVEIFGTRKLGASCAEYWLATFDREEGQPSVPTIGFGLPFDDSGRTKACTQIVPLPLSNTAPSLLSSSLPRVGEYNVRFSRSGFLRVDFDPGTEPHVQEPDANGEGLRGLPVIGFQVVNYRAGNILPGVRANYSAAVPLRRSAKRCDSCPW